MKNPTTDLEELARRPDFVCPRFPWPVKRHENECDGRDDDGDGLIDEGLVRTCRYVAPDVWFQTCKSCVPRYPNIEGIPAVECQINDDTNAIEWWCERNGGYGGFDVGGASISNSTNQIERILLFRWT